MSSRRGHNEGGIYQRESDGKWCAAIDLGIIDGKRKRKIIYGTTRREVAAKLTVMLREQQQGLPVAVERQTIGQFFDRWLTETIKPNRRAKTFRIYEQIARCHLIPTLGRVQLAKLTPQEVQRLLNEKRDEGLSPRTILHIRAVLRQGLNQALKWGLTARNVATLIDPPKAERYAITPLDPAGAARLLDAARGDRLEALYRVGLSLGLRQGEILGLRWQDVDLDRRVLHVRRQLQAVNGTLTLTEPKSAAGKRSLPLPAALVTALRQHKARQNEDRLRAGELWQDRGLVFCTKVGTPIHPRNLVRCFHALLRRAGLPPMRFHDLRHSCLSLLAAQGIPARMAMEIAGHSDIRLTQNVYTHIFDEAKQQAADAMDRLFPDVGGAV